MHASTHLTMSNFKFNTMKSYTLIAFIFIYLFSFNCATTYAQEITDYELSPTEQEGFEALQKRIEEYEKADLKLKIQNINELLEAQDISAEEATIMKLAASETAAKNIKQLNEIVVAYTSYIKRNYDNVEIDYNNLDFSEFDLSLTFDGIENLAEGLNVLGDFFRAIKSDDDDEYAEIKEKRAEVKQKRRELQEAREDLKAIRDVLYEAENDEQANEDKSPKTEYKTSKRTEGHLVIGIAFNNAVADGGSINDTEYRFGGSRTFEIGYVRTTRVFENTNWLRLVYGFSFQFNGLKPSGNRIFVDNDGVTELEEFEFNLEKNKFRMDNLIVPVHFQIGSSDTKTYDNGAKHFGSHDFKFGLGGFVGINLTTLQKLKYNNENGRDVKDKLKSGYNTNNIVYGLSTYFGWEGFAFYAQYNLNPIFKNNPVDEYNFQLGVRYDIF